MKRIMLAILITLFITSPALAEGVAITVTVPDAYVAKMAEAVSTLNCTVVDENGEIVETLAPKACLTRKVKNYLIDFLNTYEMEKAKATFDAEAKAAYQAWLESYEPIPLQ